MADADVITPADLPPAQNPYFVDGADLSNSPFWRPGQKGYDGPTASRPWYQGLEQSMIGSPAPAPPVTPAVQSMLGTGGTGAFGEAGTPPPAPSAPGTPPAPPPVTAPPTPTTTPTQQSNEAAVNAMLGEGGAGAFGESVGSQGPQTPDTGLWENFTKNLAVGAYNQDWGNRENAKSDMVANIISDVKDATGTLIPNPMLSGFHDQVMQALQARPDYATMTPDDRMQAAEKEEFRFFDQSLQQLADAHNTDSPQDQHIREVINAARTTTPLSFIQATQGAAAAAYAQHSGIAPWLAATAGEIVGGTVRNPINALGLMVAPEVGGATALARIAKEGLSWGLTQSAITGVQEPERERERAEAGQPTGFWPVMKDELYSFLGGAVPGAVMRGIREIGATVSPAMQSAAIEDWIRESQRTPPPGGWPEGNKPRAQQWRDDIDDFIRRREAGETWNDKEQRWEPPPTQQAGEPLRLPGATEPGGVGTIEEPYPPGAPPKPPEYPVPPEAQNLPHTTSVTPAGVEAAENDVRAAPPVSPNHTPGDVLANYEQGVLHAEHPESVAPPIPPVDTPDAPPSPIKPDTGLIVHAATKGEIDGKPVSFTTFDPGELRTDPATFQYKSGGNEQGATDRLAGVAQWNQMAQGNVVVWEANNGVRYIVDGHQRLALAQRLNEQSPVGAPAVSQLQGALLRQKDGWTPQDARAVAAKKNIQEGGPGADVVDIARVLRDRPDLWDKSLPTSDPKIKQAKGLSELSDEGWRMVLNGQVKPNHAALVGLGVPDKSKHVAVLNDMVKFKPQDENAARFIVNDANMTGFRFDQAHDLFGPTEAARSLAGERAQVFSHVMRILRENRRIFGMLDREQDRIEAAGNVLVPGNIDRADRSARLAAILEQLATKVGPISAELNKAALRVSEGQDPATAARQFLDELERLVRDSGLHLDSIPSPDIEPRADVDTSTPAGQAQQTKEIEEAETRRVAREEAERQAHEITHETPSETHETPHEIISSPAADAIHATIAEVQGQLAASGTPLDQAAAQVIQAIEPVVDQIFPPTLETPAGAPNVNEEAATHGEPASLEGPSEGPHEGVQPEPVQGAAEIRPVGPAPSGRGEPNGEGNGRPEAGGVQRAGGLGADQGEVSVPAGGEIGGGGPAELSGAGHPAGGEPDRTGDLANGEHDARERSRDPVNDPSAGRPAQEEQSSFSIDAADEGAAPEDETGGFKAKQKFRDNIAAIETLRRLELAHEQPTREDQQVLAKWIGWGGMPQAFRRSDGTFSKGWEKEGEQLESLLTPEQLRSAAASTRNAHYTSPEVVRAVWAALQRLGFDGGRVLEPSLGVGNFFGLMPKGLRSASALHGVELDPVTGGIAKALYPGAKIQAPMSFVDYNVPDGYFDAAVGNPPFGAERLYDPRRPDLSKFSIHNYFFAKSLDGVRPGGVMAMVVTNRFLDAANDRARRYLADKADFLGAIRLPNNAFLKNANTEVTTDIVFLRRRPAGAEPIGHPWLDHVGFTDKAGKEIPLNEYFAAHPEMMLGEFGAHGSMYGPDEPALIAREGQDTAAMLREAVARLPEKVVVGDKAVVKQESVPVDPELLKNVRVGSMFKQGGKILVRGEDELGEPRAVDAELSGSAVDRASGMIDIRDAFARVRRLQLDPDAMNTDLKSARADLNKAYDAFVKKHGFINSQANSRVFRDDPSWPQISALEDNYDRGVSKAVSKSTGEPQRPESAKKAAVFTKRTQEPYRPVTKATSAKDALMVTLAERGRVDLDHMQAIYRGARRQDILNELGPLVYEDPVKGPVTADEYLSGDVKKKLAEARQAAERDPTLERNVRALEAAQPADVPAIQIKVRPGAHWLPRETMAEFATLMTGTRASASFNPESNRWSFQYSTRPTPDAHTRWGTARKGVEEILDAVANQKQIEVRDRVDKDKTVVNEQETQAANAKAAAMTREFSRWLFEDDARREKLARIYNDMFNTNVDRQFDGSHLTLPGKVDDAIVTLRPHQANAIWRILQSNTTLLDHIVGAGKTFEMIAAAMEMRRMGLAKKPSFVVPNHLVMQWARDFVKLYPGANILAPTKRDFEADRRKKLFARIAAGDYDAVIIPHSSFGKIETDPQTMHEYIEDQVRDLVDSLNTVRAAEGAKSKNVKDIEKRITTLREKQARLLDAGKKDVNLYFKELGIDALFLDEAHEFKNLAYSTSMNRIAGLGNQAGSQKASDMHIKVRQVLDATGGRNVVFATGTPISNTMAEMYTMQRYLDERDLAARGLRHFDAWARMFGEVVHDWELSPAGKYKMNSRFAKFTNLPELMQRYRSFADVINQQDIKRMLAGQGKRLPVPKVMGGKPQNTVVPRSPAQAAYIGVPTVDPYGNETYPEGSLIWRSEHLPKKFKLEKGDDNMLKIMSDARKAALDMRLIHPNSPDVPGSKVNVAADKIKEIYDKWHADKGAQLVFCDLSTPKNARLKEQQELRDLIARAEDGDEAAQEKLDNMSQDDLLALESEFSVYDDLKQKLIDKGIPEKEIAFIHDAHTDLQKDTLFGKVRSGQVRVLMGSTAKMGAGMNVQDRLVALHHLDAPWRPSDLEQREGRIIRQGNTLYERDPDNFEVGIYRYATKQTLDARMWQTIEGKANFIEQVRKGVPGVREIEDIGGEAMNSGEMKAAASGNPKILDEMTTRRKLRELENEEETFRGEQHRIRDSIRTGSEQLGKLERQQAEIIADKDKTTPQKFSIKVGNKTFEKREDAGEAVKKLMADMKPIANRGDELMQTIGSYGDWNLNLVKARQWLGDGYVYALELAGAGRYDTTFFPSDVDSAGMILRLNKALEIAHDIDGITNAVKTQRDTLKKLQDQVGEWPKYGELQTLRERHARLVDELRGPGLKLPEGFTAQEPQGEQKQWTILSPEGEAVGAGNTRDLAIRDFLEKDAARRAASAKTPAVPAAGAPPGWRSPLVDKAMDENGNLVDRAQMLDSVEHDAAVAKFVGECED